MGPVDGTWEAFADVLLRREVALALLVDGTTPRDLAGLVVTEQDVEAALGALRGVGRGPAGTGEVLTSFEPEVTAARAAVHRGVAEGGSPFDRLVRAADPGPVAAEVLALVAGVDLDPRRQRLVQFVQDDVQLRRPTLWTLRRVGRRDGDDGWAAHVAPGSPLVRAGLVEVDASGPWAVRCCGLPDRVAWHLTGSMGPAAGPVDGDTVLDPDTPPGTRWTPGPGTPRPASLVLVHGADRVSRRLAALARWPDAPVVTSPQAPGDRTGWLALVREATCRGAVLLVEVEEPLDGAARRVVEDAAHLPAVLSSPTELPLETVPQRPWTELHVSDGDADDGDWRAELGREPDPATRLSREQLRLVAAAASADGGRLQPAVRRLAGGHLDRLAVRIRPSRGWDDLVLPADQEARLRELVARYRHRRRVHEDWGFTPSPSTGVVALFAGPSGTGKTLAAEVLAGDLGLDVYRVDLSSVVSKYIGETEKNLERIFTAAATADLVLFFDEADALFGKRSEVSDAHDRYANIEVAYLLQRLERHDGLVVLATNLQRNIDQAFTRRISVAVDFPVPDEEQRLALWRRAFPATAPVVDLDVEFLARSFKVTGGVIVGAALGAAFRAADEGTAIDMEHVALALGREYQKLGRLRTKEEFGRWFPLVAGGPGAAPAR
ncbi:ATP-binding protein [Thalassiella azotivora]